MYSHSEVLGVIQHMNFVGDTVQAMTEFKNPSAEVWTNCPISTMEYHVAIKGSK